MEKMKDVKESNRVVITVAGGVAEVHTCPCGVDVLVVDYDNLDCMEFREVDGETAAWLRANDEDYWAKMRTRFEPQPIDADSQTCN